MSKTAKLVETTTKRDCTIYSFTTKEDSRHTLLVVKHPVRGMIAVTQYREKCRVIGFMQGRDESIDDVMGLPALEHEAAYDNIPEQKAIAIAERIFNMVTTTK